MSQDRLRKEFFLKNDFFINHIGNILGTGWKDLGTQDYVGLF